MKTVTNHFSSEICELADRAAVCVAVIQTARQDLDRAEEINDDEPPTPKWWWRLSPYLRATARNYQVAQEVLKSAPLVIELVSAELKEIRAILRKGHRIDFCYEETRHGGLRLWLEARGGDVYEISEPDTLFSRFSK